MPPTEAPLPLEHDELTLLLTRGPRATDAAPPDADDPAEQRFAERVASTHGTLLWKLVTDGAGDRTAPLAESRRTVRYPKSLPVLATPLDATGEPVGPPVELTLCDVSFGGAGLASIRPISADWLRLELDVAGVGPVELTGRVAWKERRGKVTRLGCEFVTLPEASPPA